MLKLDLYSKTGEKLKAINLKKEIFAVTKNDNVLYDAIILSRASLRQGTHKTKNRSEVSGGGRKPWRQKGTGRARQGSIRAVQWRGGGNYGTPVPRDYSIKMNKKERRVALLTALTYKAEAKEIIPIEELVFETPKTKEMIEFMNALNIADKKILIVVKELTENAILASRNLRNIVLIESNEVNVLDLVASDVVVFEADALKQLEEVLS